MSIRSKIIALIGGIFVILGLAEVLVERQIVMPSFAELERVDTQTAMRRLEYTLDHQLQELATSAGDWGNWADTWNFAVDRNADFVATNLTSVALHQLNVNLLMIVDSEGRYLEVRDLDLQAEQPLGLDLATREALPADFPWRGELKSGIPVRGLLPTNHGVLMLAGAPILDGRQHGPARGMVILGRLLSAAVVRDIGAQAQASLALLPPGPSRQEFVQSDDTTTLYRLFDDIYGRPVMTLQVDVPRRITARGRLAVAYASAGLLMAAVLVLALLIFVLTRTILQPLGLLTRHAVSLGENPELATSLQLQRRDEFGVLANEFDRMVERLAQSRMQLVDQSFESGFAELAKGVLHNLGNAMTPISVRLGVLHDRLRGAPAVDAERAVAELTGAVGDPQRAADLQRFVQLACRELAAAVRASQEDAAQVIRQTSLIQSTLAEQMRSARNAPVIEPVRLTDLVSQSLELVPDAALKRLEIVSDDSLRRLGAVRVARTQLRLVLQNLIINAADAVRDAGRDRGTLRIRADTIEEPHRVLLHMVCTDDGTGIEGDKLAKVFEKGYTTKSRETNHGIGLHWCANAIGALGGRIWAESDGPGCGASLHFTVPLALRDAAPLAGAA